MCKGVKNQLTKRINRLYLLIMSQGCYERRKLCLKNTIYKEESVILS